MIHLENILVAGFAVVLDYYGRIFQTCLLRKILKRSVLIHLESIEIAKFCSDFGLLLENISKINCAQNFKVISALLCNIVLSWFE